MIRSFSVLSVLCLAVSASAFAMPAVGDVALFDLAATVNGNQYNGTVEISLTEFNAANQQYHEKQVLNIAGQNQVQDQWVESKNLPTEALINAVLGNCAAYGGTSEKITVPAGAFDTCVMPFNDNGHTGKSWIGQTVFGVVKNDDTQTSNGTHAVMSLRSFTNGH